MSTGELDRSVAPTTCKQDPRANRKMGGTWSLEADMLVRAVLMGIPRMNGNIRTPDSSVEVPFTSWNRWGI